MFLALSTLSLTFTNYLFPNYREEKITEWFILYFALACILYILAVYILALTLRQNSKRNSEIEPVFLVSGCTVGLLIGSLLLKPTALGFFILFIPIIFSVLGIWIACKFKRRKSTNNPIILLLRILIPPAIALTVILVNKNGFPGVKAPAEVRQQWAYQEFSNYGELVNSIKSCKPVIERLGNVKFVAPTQGKNYVVSEPGSSGHHGKFTLEVVGEKSSGIANFKVHIFTGVSRFQFKHQNKVEDISCYRPENPIKTSESSSNS